MNKKSTLDIKPILAEQLGSLYIDDPVAWALKELVRVMSPEDRRQFDDDDEEDFDDDFDDDDDEEEEDLFDDDEDLFDDDEDDFDEDDDLYARHGPTPVDEPGVRHPQIIELARADVRFI